MISVLHSLRIGAFAFSMGDTRGNERENERERAREIHA